MHFFFLSVYMTIEFRASLGTSILIETNLIEEFIILHVLYSFSNTEMIPKQ